MSTLEAAPVACSLTPQDYRQRIARMRDLTRDALLNHEREDLTLRLYYASHARSRVAAMVRDEEKCCAFMTFDIREDGVDVIVTIKAPEEARESADMIFEQFTGSEFTGSETAGPSCGCASSGSARRPSSSEKKVAATAAVTAAGAVACAACCVLPFALPAALLASVGGIIAWVDRIHPIVTLVAALVVAGAWGWVVLQSVRTRRRPAYLTIAVMVAASALASVAVSWPVLKGPIIRVLG